MKTTYRLMQKCRAAIAHEEIRNSMAIPSFLPILSTKIHVKTKPVEKLKSFILLSVDSIHIQGVLKPYPENYLALQMPS